MSASRMSVDMRTRRDLLARSLTGGGGASDRSSSPDTTNGDVNQTPPIPLDQLPIPGSIPTPFVRALSPPTVVTPPPVTVVEQTEAVAYDRIPRPTSKCLYDVLLLCLLW